MSHHANKIERESPAHLLQLRCHHVVASRSLEVCTGEDEDGDGCEEEDTGEDGVGLEGEDEVG